MRLSAAGGLESGTQGLAAIARALWLLLWVVGAGCGGGAAEGTDVGATDGSPADNANYTLDLAPGDTAAANPTTTDTAGADTWASDATATEAPHLCEPCTSNSQCAGANSPEARCVQYGPAGSYCAIPCVIDEQCPQDYQCAAIADVAGAEVSQCVRAAGLDCPCSAAAMAAHLATPCYQTPQTSTCKGTRTCLAAGEVGAPSGGGLSACSAPAAVPEVCNGTDDDCDGQTDEATCDDQNPCTTDTCNSIAGCSQQAQTGGCDDGNACTSNTECTQGACGGGKPIACDDKNVCTVDACNPTGGCVHTPVADGIPCDDGVECTVGDTCSTGKCGKPLIWNVKTPMPAYNCDLVGMVKDAQDGITLFGGCPGSAKFGLAPIANHLDAFGTLTWTSAGPAVLGLSLLDGAGLTDGSLLAVGSVTSATDSQSVALVRWLPSGATPTTTIEASDQVGLASAVTAVNGGYLLGVQIAGQAWIQRRDLGDNVVWQTKVGGTGTVVFGLCPVNADGFVAAGANYPTKAGPSSAWLGGKASPTQPGWTATLPASATPSSAFLAVAATDNAVYAVGYAGFGAMWGKWGNDGQAVAFGIAEPPDSQTMGSKKIFTDLVASPGGWLMAAMGGGGLSPLWSAGFQLWDGAGSPKPGWGSIGMVAGRVLVGSWSGGVDLAAPVESGPAPFPGWQVQRVAWSGQASCP